MEIAENDALTLLAGVITVIGAANWTTIEFFEYDLLTDLLKLSAGSAEYTAVVGIIGLAAVVELYVNLYYNVGEI